MSRHAIGVFNGNWKNQWNRDLAAPSTPKITDAQYAEFLREQIEKEKTWVAYFEAQGNEKSAASTREFIGELQAKLDALTPQAPHSKGQTS